MGQNKKEGFDFIVCKLCGKEVKVISASHLKMEHNITLSEYKTQFPNDPLVCAATKQHMKKSALKRYKSKAMTKQTKEKISETLRKKYQV